jgi:DNA-directed RNA polymerase subunit K/omega
VKNGVPFDVAFSLPDEERKAWSIALGEIDGGKFNFDMGRWEERA